MLNSIRKISKGPIGWVIFGIIFIPFLFFGIQSYFINSSESDVINVGDESLSNFQFNNLWQQELQNLQRQNMPDQLTDIYRNNLILNLISRLTIENFLNQEGHIISDNEVGLSIANDPNFFKQGKFSKDLYLQLLSQNRIQIESYENSVRDQLQIAQFNQLITHALFLNQAQFSHLSDLVSQKRSGGYQIFSVDNFIDAIEVSDEEIQERYQLNPSAYLWPERVQLAYLLIEKEQLAIDTISQDEVRLIYQNDEARGVREIFIEGHGNPESLALANQLVEKINTEKEEFYDLILYTDDPQGMVKKGRLNSTAIERGMLGENFETVIFGLNEREAGIVETQVGYHIVWVEKIYSYKQANFNKVRATIENQLIEQKKNQAFQAALEQAKSINYDVIDNLDQISTELNLDIEQTDFIDVNLDNLPELFNHPKVIEQIFAEDLIAGSNSEVIELNSNQAIVFRHQIFEESREKTLQQAKDEILRNLKMEKAIVALKSQLDEQIASLNNQNFNDLSEVFEGWQNFEDLDLNQVEQTNLSREIAQSIFNLRLSDENAFSITTVILPENEVAVVALSEVSFKETEVLSNQEIIEINNIHNQIINEAIIRSVLTQLSSEYGVFVSNDILAGSEPTLPNN